MERDVCVPLFQLFLTHPNPSDIRVWVLKALVMGRGVVDHVDCFCSGDGCGY